ncbi:hypothetical protein OKW43_008556 [Paraburkholderia sp. WC7.3g]
MEWRVCAGWFETLYDECGWDWLGGDPYLQAGAPPSSLLLHARQDVTQVNPEVVPRLT